ncbi:hypothetical protein PR202_gb25509 [Eleusine coracana subsp. coracana]|uniref:Cytochrome P450 716B1 n=1 Tax=Eleusine coracana subsp. coracana TaxID=191504 RepID=A0AAV5FQD1_ELECO|nr:hypothetical protein QOZ80_8BG0651240 [Eleusine coracana subsp. coracana]GJN36630.1 hypothetical protein PR202_gb25509 [Eleusine coracana subsp. coracana]
MLAAAVTIVAVVVASLLMVLPAGRAREKTKPRKPVPPGSFGLPFIGQTFRFLRALRTNTGEEWLHRQTSTYGPVSRLSLFGCPTAMLAGASGNKFIFASSAVINKKPESMARMIGRRTIRDVEREDHRRIRAIMVQFLRPDACKRYVASFDDEVQRHLDAEWHGRGIVAVMPSMKDLTFDLMCTVIFALGRDGGGNAFRKELSMEFRQMVKGITAVPLNLPFTSFSKCLAASQRGRRMVSGVIQERRAKLEQAQSSPTDDVITQMIAEGLPEEEIIDNVMLLMIAAHDTSASLLTFLIRHLDANRDAYDKVVQEQEEIARCKVPGEALTWEDLGRMRQTIDYIEFGGYRIPKGWQALQTTTTTQWDPTIFPDPGRFEPARFENPSAIPPYCFIPFGVGPHICPGNEVARVETLVTMHYIVTRFRWRLAAGCDGSYTRSPHLSPSQGLLIDLEPIVQGRKA